MQQAVIWNEIVTWKLMQVCNLVLLLLVLLLSLLLKPEDHYVHLTTEMRKCLGPKTCFQVISLAYSIGYTDISSHEMTTKNIFHFKIWFIELFLTHIRLISVS